MSWAYPPLSRLADGYSIIMEMTDAELLAKAMVWAAQR